MTVATSPQSHHAPQKRQLCDNNVNTSSKFMRLTDASVSNLCTELTRKQEPDSAEPAKTAMTDDHAVLSVLFSGLETVLQLLTTRNLKASLPTVRADVERFTSRELNDARLHQILGLADTSMIDVEWVGTGKAANIEFIQRAHDGSRRPPTMDEQKTRKTKFDTALAQAIARGEIPHRALPPRPSTPEMPLSKGTWGTSTLPTPAVCTRQAIVGASVEQRKQGLLERVRAREAAGHSDEAKLFEGLRYRIRTCDNAITAHKILQSLFARGGQVSALQFARGQGSSSAAREDELMTALCSASFSVQSMQKLDKAVAQDAVDLLAELAVEWFTVKQGVHNPELRIFRKFPNGSAAKALAAVTDERQNLETQLSELCEGAKQRELEISSLRGDESALGRNAGSVHRPADQDVKAPVGRIDKHEVPLLSKPKSPTENAIKFAPASVITDMAPQAPLRNSSSPKLVATLEHEQRPQKRLRKKTAATIVM